MYHAALPPPELSTELERNPCAVNGHDQFESDQEASDALESARRSVGISTDQIDRLVSLCVDLYRQSGASHTGEALRRLPRDDGILLEATRLTVGSVRDALWQAANAVRLRNSIVQHVYTIPEPTWWEPQLVREHLAAMAGTALGTQSGKEFETKLEYMVAAFNEEQKAADAQANGHVTKDDYTPEEMNRLIMVLTRHKMVGPVLSKIKVALQTQSGLKGLDEGAYDALFRRHGSRSSRANSKMREQWQSSGLGKTALVP